MCVTCTFTLTFNLSCRKSTMVCNGPFNQLIDIRGFLTTLPLQVVWQVGETLSLAGVSSVIVSSTILSSKLSPSLPTLVSTRGSVCGSLSVMVFSSCFCITCIIRLHTRLHTRPGNWSSVLLDPLHPCRRRHRFHRQMFRGP